MKGRMLFPKRGNSAEFPARLESSFQVYGSIGKGQYKRNFCHNHAFFIAIPGLNTDTIASVLTDFILKESRLIRGVIHFDASSSL